MEINSATPVSSTDHRNDQPFRNLSRWSESDPHGSVRDFLHRTLLIVDDHQVIRQSLRALFAEDGIHNIIEAENCAETIGVLQEHDVAVVLLDLSLRHESGLDVLRAIKAMPRPPKVLMHSFHDEVVFLSRCYQAAADGYLVKGTDRDVLLQAVCQAACGERIWTDEQLQQIQTLDACCSSSG